MATTCLRPNFDVFILAGKDRAAQFQRRINLVYRRGELDGCRAHHNLRAASTMPTQDATLRSPAW